MKNNARSDTSSPSKAKQRSERYLRYQKYIRSKQFKEVRKLVWERCEGECQFCGRKQSDGVTLSVHHKSYRNLYKGGIEEANDCILICQREHKLLHSMKCNMKWFSMDNNRNKTDDNDENNRTDTTP